jgi:hypothetical protein
MVNFDRVMSADDQRRLFENLSNSLFLLLRAPPLNDQPVFTFQERDTLERMYEILQELYDSPETFDNRRFFSSDDE